MTVYFTDIFHITYKLGAIVGRTDHRWKEFRSAAIRQSRFVNLAVGGSLLAQFCRHLDTPLLSFFSRRWLSRPTPERVFAVDHQSIPGFSGTNSLVRQPRSGQGALDRQTYRRQWWSWNREIPTSNGGRNQPAKGNVCFHPLGDTERVCSNVYITLILIAESAKKISNITTYLENRGLILI